MRFPRLRLKVSTLLAWTVVIALVLALIVQQISADRRERGLKAQLRQTLRHHYSLEGMVFLLGERGIDILKNVESVELLRVAAPITDASGASPAVGVVTPTGLDPGYEFAPRAVGVLLDHRNYGYINGDDFSDPQIGLRIKSGASTLDILISLEGSSPGSPHQDVWIEIHDQTGKLVHYAGPHCMNDPTLQKLAEELLKK